MTCAFRKTKGLLNFRRITQNLKPLYGKLQTIWRGWSDVILPYKVCGGSTYNFQVKRQLQVKFAISLILWGLRKFLQIFLESLKKMFEANQFNKFNWNSHNLRSLLFLLTSTFMPFRNRKFSRDSMPTTNRELRHLPYLQILFIKTDTAIFGETNNKILKTIIAMWVDRNRIQFTNWNVFWLVLN